VTTPSMSPSRSMPARLVGALLCLGVAAIHVIDQGGVPGSKTPTYVGIGYYVLETVGILTAIWLVARPARAAWFVTVGVAAGPLLGYVLSRGPGLPDYADDRGNWTEPLGLLSLLVEGVLLVLSATQFLRRGRVADASESAPRHAASQVDA
jgi:hypothetical protein